jgi:hypothetical protein
MCEHRVRDCVLIHRMLVLREGIPPHNPRLIIGGVPEHVLASGIAERPYAFLPPENGRVRSSAQVRVGVDHLVGQDLHRLV